MKNLSNLMTLVCLLSAMVGHGQSTTNSAINNNGGEKVTAKKSVMNANWLIESLVIEMALYDFSKNNNMKSMHLLKQNALKSNKSSKLFRSNNSALATLNLMESVVVKRFSTKEQVLKGTAPIHLILEKYPQVVSAVPPKLSLPMELGNRQKSFGSLLKF